MEMDPDAAAMAAMLGPRPKAARSPSSSSDDDDSESLSELSEDEAHYHQELQQRRSEYWLPAEDHNDEETMEAYGSALPSWHRPMKMPRPSNDPIVVEMRERACDEREQRLAKRLAAFHREVATLAAKVLDQEGSSIYGTDMQQQNRELLGRKRHCLEQDLLRLHRAVREADEPEWLPAVPAPVQQAYRAPEAIMDDAVLCRLITPFDAWALLRQPETRFYTHQTEQHWAVMAVHDDTLLFYVLISKDSLAL